MYKGKEICQGCKKTGDGSPREEKNQLCYNCLEIFKLGKSTNFDESIEYVTVKDWVNGFSTIDFDDNSLDELGNRILEALDNESAKAPERVVFKRGKNPYGAIYYRIPKKVAEPLDEFLIALNNKIEGIKKLKTDAEKFAKEAVHEEKDRIFSEGVAKGKDLLFQLSNGEITMNDFEKKVNY